MKVANIIIAHRNPQQLYQLVNQFSGDLFHNFIHIDQRVDHTQFEDTIQCPHVTLLPNRIKINWSGFGFVQVCYDAFIFIGKQGQEFGYYSVLSGQDYPIKPSNQFYDVLKNSNGKEFFQIASMEEWPQGYHRFERYHLIDWNFKGRYRLEDLINLFIPKRKLPYDLIPFGRSAWFTATSDFINYAVDYINTHPKYWKFLKSVWGVDEIAFSTLVMNSSFKDHLYPGNLRYIDWSENNASPKLLRMEDLEALKKSNCYLARKFDEKEDHEILLELNKHLTASH